MNFTESLMVGRDFEELGRAADQMRTWLADVLDDDRAAKVELAFVEALSNSIRHAPSDRVKPIGIFLDVSDAEVAIEIADDSPPMPTLFHGAGEQKLDLATLDRENLAEGGRGLSLIVLSMDQVSFVLSAGQVRLRMVLNRG